MSYLDSKSTLFEVINNFRLYDRVCIVSALRASCFISTSWKLSETLLGAFYFITLCDIQIQMPMKM